MEVRPHDAEREVALHILEKRMTGEPTPEGLLRGQQERASDKGADRGARDSEPTRMTGRPRQPELAKGSERARQSVTHELEVVAWERAPRAGAFSDNPQVAKADVARRALRHTVHAVGLTRQSDVPVQPRRLRIAPADVGCNSLDGVYPKESHGVPKGCRSGVHLKDRSIDTDLASSIDIGLTVVDEEHLVWANVKV